MATKSVNKTRIGKVAEKIAAIAGTLAGKKNLIVKKASIAIDTVKSKVHDLTAPPRAATKKAAKKGAKKVKAATKKVAKKATAAKKKVTKAANKVKKVARKAARK